MVQISIGNRRTQASDVYQTSLTVFELIYSSFKNKWKIKQKKYEEILKIFTNPRLTCDKRFPANFLDGYEALKMVSFFRIKLFKNNLMIS